MARPVEPFRLPTTASWRVAQRRFTEPEILVADSTVGQMRKEGSSALYHVGELSTISSDRAPQTSEWRWGDDERHDVLCITISVGPFYWSPSAGCAMYVLCESAKKTRARGQLPPCGKDCMSCSRPRVRSIDRWSSLSSTSPALLYSTSFLILCGAPQLTTIFSFLLSYSLCCRLRPSLLSPRSVPLPWVVAFSFTAWAPRLCGLLTEQRPQSSALEEWRWSVVFDPTRPWASGPHHSGRQGMTTGLGPPPHGSPVLVFALRFIVCFLSLLSLQALPGRHQRDVAVVCTRCVVAVVSTRFSTSSTAHRARGDCPSLTRPSMSLLVSLLMCFANNCVLSHRMHVQNGCEIS